MCTCNHPYRPPPFRVSRSWATGDGEQGRLEGRLEAKPRHAAGRGWVDEWIDQPGQVASGAAEQRGCDNVMAAHIRAYGQRKQLPMQSSRDPAKESVSLADCHTFTALRCFSAAARKFLVYAVIVLCGCGLMLCQPGVEAEGRQK